MAGEPENQRIARLTPLADVLASIKTARAGRAARGRSRRVRSTARWRRTPPRRVGQPAEARALRDGYAVRAEDIADAGSYAPVPLAAAPVRVDVGDALPPGTDAVVPLDAIVERGGRFEAIAPAAAGDGVLPCGADLQAGDFIARAGWRLNDFNLAMLAMAGMKQVHVREPRIRLVKARADADVVLDTVGDLLARALNARGCAVRRSAGDLAAALADSADDAVIAIGGTGSGRNDTSVTTLAKQGRVVAHGIAISPGETAAFGMSGNRPVLLLPGRIDAAIAGWLTMGLPLIDRLAGSSEGSDPSTVAKLARKVASPIGLVEIVPVRLAKGQAEPIASGYWPLAPLANTDGWILVPAEQRRFAGRKRGRGKTLAMSDRLDKSAASHDLIETIRRAARQEQFLEVVSADEARARFARHVDLAPLPAERVTLAASLGRVLAHDVKAPIDVPPFDRSNVDGFAVRAADTVGASDTAPKRLRLNRGGRRLRPRAHAPASSPAPPPPSPPAAWCRAAPTPS